MPWFSPCSARQGEAGGIGAGIAGHDRYPLRSPQIFSCSTAAARKVSPAAITDLPCPDSAWPVCR